MRAVVRIKKDKRKIVVDCCIGRHATLQTEERNFKKEADSKSEAVSTSRQKAIREKDQYKDVKAVINVYGGISKDEILAVGL